MNKTIITSALSLGISLAMPLVASAQTGGRTAIPPQPGNRLPGVFTPPPANPRAATTGANAKKDPNLLRSNDQVPEPIALDEIQRPNIAAPAEPIEGYLLQKENGPFMVLAYTFRGPEASKYAQILAMELRKDYHLPAYIWLAKVQPMRSLIYGIQPTAPPHARNGDMSPPERYRTYDEAAVLVGNCKSIDESEKLHKDVKKIVPSCLANFPVIYQNRKGKGLNRAIMTTNPFQASQNLFPGNGPPVAGMPVKQGQAFDPFVVVSNFEKARKIDPDVRRWNTGPNSVFKNPGAYTLQVAETSGRVQVAVTTEKGFAEKIATNDQSLKQSPLVHAAEDAERLAESLNKCKSMGGLKAYVLHTRSSSIVTIGSFRTADDKTALAVRDGQIQAISNELIKRGFSRIPLRPAGELMMVPKD